MACSGSAKRAGLVSTSMEGRGSRLLNMVKVHIGDLVAVRFRESFRVLRVVGMGCSGGKFHFEGILLTKPRSDRSKLGTKVWILPSEVVRVVRRVSG